ncbi:hypothetical protein IMY05_006G0135700 [Salix suchowensis]|nr:hypothetical protein IMY05_006G0135700 [Salix suchowensis]
MELKYSVATTFLLCLLLVTPYNISRETHSSVVPPPAGRSRDRPWIHQDSVKTSHKPQGSRGDDRGEQANEIHG